ncbi:MAG: amidase, partial [Solirubrobacterales bacterium]
TRRLPRAAARYPRHVDATELAFAGISAQAEMLRSKQVSSAELVELYLDRIERLDPQLNSFRAVYEERARAGAKEADARIGKGEEAPLLGVPVALKDDLDVAGEVTYHGTRAFDEPATQDSFHWARIRDAGAVLLGKTNLPELGIYGFTESDGWGVTRNPWDLGRTPAGSSGGSGAAVSAGLVGAAAGSDGAGSIRFPAANCHLFGLKPQRGRISLAPHGEHWSALTVTGCLSRRVADTALWMDIASGSDPSDHDPPAPPGGSYVDAAAKDPGKLRVAWSLKPPRAIAPPIVTDSVKNAVARTVDVLQGLGHEVEQCDPDWGQLGNGAAPRYLKGITDSVAEVPYPDRLEPRTRAIARLGERIPERLLDRAHTAESTDAARVNAIFERFDVLVMPTVGEPPVPVRKWDGKGALRTIIGMSRTYPFGIPFNYTGQPAASVPAGFTADGLPLSAQLVAPPNGEQILFSLSAQLEAELRWYEERPPVS